MSASAAAVDTTSSPEPAELLAIAAAVARRSERLLAWRDAAPPRPDAEAEAKLRSDWRQGSADGRRLTAAVLAADLGLAAIPNSRLARLEHLFGLSARERELLMVSVAPQVAPALLQLYERLHNRPWPTEALASDLFDWGRLPLWHPGTALALWGLVSEGRSVPAEPPPLLADPALRFWLSGQFAVDAELRAHFTRIGPRGPLAGWQVDRTAEKVRRANEDGHSVRLVVEGLPGSGRATFAADVAAALGLAAFALSPPPGAAELSDEIWIRAQRAALVAGAALVWQGGWAEARWPRLVRPAPLQAVTVEPGTLPAADGRFVDQRVALPKLARADRERLLDAFVPAAASWDPREREGLVGRRTLTVGNLHRLGRHRPGDWRSASEALNALQADAFGDLASRMEASFTWDDLVLPEDLKAGLRDLAHECRMRVEFWSDERVRRLYGRESGIACLFAGPPGVGKSMCAQVIAADLGYELHRVDCATVTSKYIGETSKNLRSIFARARAVDAVLLFDEAEALFAARTDVRDAHDRYANADTAYLLQLIENDFEGIAILATNRKADIDPAFMRRLRHVYDFPRPAPAERVFLWRLCGEALVTPAALKALEPFWRQAAETLDLTGAQIKAAMMSAHFAAARRGVAIGVADILTGLDRELGKEGRSISADERGRLMRHA
jgi:AAA+ superfamily predicted ATPase